MTAPSWMPRWLLPATAVLTVVPLAVAALAQRDARWHPVFDLAMTELRVRDVGGRHTPLIGLQGRIGPSGSHPGPLSFYLLAPTYRLLGSSAFALQAATAVFHGLAAIAALLVANRRRDARLLLAVAALVLLLVQGYGLGALTEPWNPHLPVLWFVVFLLALWAVVDGDLPMLVPAVVAGSICAQTHVPYLALTVGLGGATGVVAIWRARTADREGGGRSGWLAVGAAAVTGVVLWVPPLVDEAINEPGNLTKIVDHLGSPAETPIGLRRAGTLMLERLDTWQLVVVESAHPGTFVRILEGPGPSSDRGTVTAVAWAGAVAAAVTLRHRRLLGLHAVVGLAAVVGTVAISRIYGVPWHYLMLWGFGIGALMALAVLATAVALLQRTWPALAGERGRRATAVVALVAVVGLSGRLLLLAPDASTETPDQTEQLGRVVPATVTALEQGTGAASGRDGRYQVRWDDATDGGSVGIGMVNELVRRGFDVGVDDRDRVRIGPHRVLDADDATAVVVVASGGWIDRWAEEEGAVRVAYDDPRSDALRAEFEEVRAAALAELQAMGRTDLVERVDRDLFDVALNAGLPPGVSLLLGRMIDIGVPAAVFVVPPEAAA